MSEHSRAPHLRSRRRRPVSWQWWAVVACLAFLGGTAGFALSSSNSTNNSALCSGPNYDPVTRRFDPSCVPQASTTATVTTTPTPTDTSTTPLVLHPDLALPARGTFSYPWYPEAWSQSGANPATRFHPTAGLYTSTSVMDQQVQSLLYGKFDFDVSSWWGQGDKTDARFGPMLAAAHGTALKIAPYYEAEGSADARGGPTPSVAQITSDLNYIAEHYIDDPNYLYVRAKPVIFAFGDGSDNCSTADRWKIANAQAATRFYVVLKVFVRYAACTNQPDNWHQYGPAIPVSVQGHHSITVSPGFFKFNEAKPRLGRDLSQFQTDVNTMNCAKVDLKLITTFNEWGEGTSVESATEWASSSGQGHFLDVLHSSTACSTATHHRAAPPGTEVGPGAHT